MASKYEYVHRNTITYRVNLITSIFDINFDNNFQNLIYLQSIIQIYYLTGNLKNI